jgi:hypothetical protein
VGLVDALLGDQKPLFFCTDSPRLRGRWSPRGKETQGTKGFREVAQRREGRREGLATQGPLKI